MPKQNNNTIVHIQDVWKRYYSNSNQRPRTLKSAVASRFRYWTERDAYWALQGVDLQIKKGQTVGLIGNNGAGKSTLLRLIGGLSRPTRGKIIQHGRLGSLLELGAGFSPEFTGRESVITGSIISGLTRKEALARLDKVVEFAELQDFINSPIRTYSSGMWVRLAFATEISLEPDVLLVDEVLAVGDMAFQKKCLNYIMGMKEQGKTIIVVSHSMDQIQQVCDEVVWLEHGRVRAQGTTREIVERYKNRVFESVVPLETSKAETNRQPQLVAVGSANDSSNPTAEPGLRATAPVRERRDGSIGLKFDSATICDETGRPVKTILTGSPLILKINYTAYQPLVRPIFMVTLRDAEGYKCYEINTQEDGTYLEHIEEGPGSFNLYFGSLPLVNGKYSFSLGAYSQNWDYTFEYRNQICEFQVEGPITGSGIVHVAHRWQLD